MNALAGVFSILEMKEVAWEEVKKSFEGFCLMAGVESLMKMLEEDAEDICGLRDGRRAEKRGHRWGTTREKVGFHGGTIDVDRPRVRDRNGKNIPLPSWEAARDAGFLKQWAMLLTLKNVATRKFGRAVLLPDATLPSANGSGLSKSAVARRFVALSKAIRRTFGADIPIQRCQVHKARNILDRLPPELHAGVRRTLRQSWEPDDPVKAERLIQNLAQRLEREAPGVSQSILEGLDEILTVNRLGLPPDLRRSLACTNIIESMNSVIRLVCRSVKRRRNVKMGLRWTAAGMLEARKGFRRLKAHKHLPVLKAALQNHRSGQSATPAADRLADAA